MTAIAASSTAMNIVVANTAAMNAVIANSTAMTAIAASSTAMNIVVANQTALSTIIASSTAMNIVAASAAAMLAFTASATAMNAVVANQTALSIVNGNDQAIRIWMLAGTNQVYKDFVNYLAVVASGTAMTAIAYSKTALLCIWSNELILAAIRGNSTAINALSASPYAVFINNTSSNLTSAMVTTKSILVTALSVNGGDTFYLSDKYSNGVLVGNYTYNATASWMTLVLAFSNIKHYQTSTNNRTWQAYIIDCD
jgi:hypothetical protein